MATTIWQSSVAKDGYIRLVGDVSTGKVTGVKGVDLLDVDNYDNSNYRDTFLGAGLLQDFAFGGTDYVTQISDPTGTPTEKKVVIGSSPTEYTASDNYLHVPPRFEQRRRSLLRFWDGTVGTSNVLASCWADEFMGFSPEPYVFI